MISYTFVDGFTRIDRDDAIERLKRAIARADGVIVDFAFFGAEAIRLTVELDAASALALREELAQAEIELFTGGVADLDAAAKMDPSHPILAMLHVRFLEAQDEDADAAAHSQSLHAH